MTSLIEILEKINSGTLEFDSVTNSKDDLADFQAIAKLLLQAKDLGLIENLREHYDSDNSIDGYNNSYDSFGLSGLSNKGIEYLAINRKLS